MAAHPVLALLLATVAVGAVSARVLAGPEQPGAAAAGASPRPTAAAASPAPLPAAGFRWPLQPQPRVLRGFQVGPQRWSPGHRGVDLAATGGQQVLAAAAGTVSFAGRVAGRGVVVVVHAAGVRTSYEPVAAGVHAGLRVRAGEPLGIIEPEQQHCGAGPCLHWGARSGDTYLDPLTLLPGPRRPAVLLPLAAPGLSSPHRAWPAAAARPWCASGRCATR